MNKKRFKATILQYFKRNGRHDLPWRLTKDPYRILVSEVMLQQTQVSRVLKKYPEFLKKFPTTKVLARAKNAEVLKAWQGLGYNRRALALKRAAESVERDFDGTFPRTAEALESLPGVGQSTRGAIMAFAFGIPTVFIETNIRAVFIHFFFTRSKSTHDRIHDRDILPIVEETLDHKDPCTWYYALMDYGVYLKQTLPNPSRKSAHHTHQSPFKGSSREIRSRILKIILESPTGKEVRKDDINIFVGKTRYNVDIILRNLVHEGFIHETADGFRA